VVTAAPRHIQHISYRQSWFPVPHRTTQRQALSATASHNSGDAVGGERTAEAICCAATMPFPTRRHELVPCARHLSTHINHASLAHSPPEFATRRRQRSGQLSHFIAHLLRSEIWCYRRTREVKISGECVTSIVVRIVGTLNKNTTKANLLFYYIVAHKLMKLTPLLR